MVMISPSTITIIMIITTTTTTTTTTITITGEITEIITTEITPYTIMEYIRAGELIWYDKTSLPSPLKQIC